MEDDTCMTNPTDFSHHDSGDEYLLDDDGKPLPLESVPCLDLFASVDSTIHVVAGTAHRALAESIVQLLNTQSPSGPNQDTVFELKVDGQMSCFADGEISVQIMDNVREKDVYIIQPTCPPDVNKHLMELLLLIHTLKMSSAKSITCVVPYYGYARQDRKTKPRTPISASCVAQLIECQKPNRVITLDLHCGQIQGFFHRTPVDNLYAENMMATWVRSQPFDMSMTCIVSPDAGGVTRARRLADLVNAPTLATILKERAVANQIKSAQLIGDVSGKTCIIVDDMIDTAGTLCAAAQLLIEQGAKEVYACASHGLFSGPAFQRITDCPALKGVVVTNSIPQQPELCSKLTVLDIAPLMANAISRCHFGESLSALFKP
jgi:ribose-phosphate pyrophosphokinase